MNVAERAYRALVRLYPRAFRERFGDEMLQTFRDWRGEDSDIAERPDALAWLGFVSDEVTSIVEQHVIAMRSVVMQRWLVVTLATSVVFLALTAGIPSPSTDPQHSAARAAPHAQPAK